MREAASVEPTISDTTPGDEQSVAALLPAVYSELRAMAGGYLRGDARHTLQPTALVHEAYMKMVGANTKWSGRDHFLAIAAKAMRQVLVDHARKRLTAKRGGDGGKHAHRAGVAMEAIADDARNNAGSTHEVSVMELDELLTELARTDPRAARGAEMRLFGGMEQEQIARVLGISRTLVTTDWQFARAWLALRYKGEPDGDPSGHG